MKRSEISFGLARLLFALWAVTPAHAATTPLQSVPRAMAYQGFLADASGNALTGTRAMRFGIYVSGTRVWYSEYSSVQVAAGVFNVLLGDTGQGGTALDPVTSDFITAGALPVDAAVLLAGGPGAAVEVEIEIYNGSAFETLSPRLKKSTAAFAHIADTVDGYDSSRLAKQDLSGAIVSSDGTAVIDATGQWLGSTAGLVGPTGPQGAAGAAGANGAVGAVGATGAQGDAGAVGPQGLQGLPGTAGANGAVGATGAQGPIGANGANGAIGATGPQGPQGVAGNNGAVGATGSQGPAGSQGIAGAVGATGAQGFAGVAGANGSTGAIGATGVQGPQGVAGSNGTNGAVGATGPQGLAGTNGTNGAIGATGASGAQGPIGFTGAAGAIGTTGVTGATGAQGPQGLAGTNGTNGTNGAIGATGAQGPQGLAGTNGTNGAVGATGAQGTAGAVGATGPQGVAGATGVFAPTTDTKVVTVNINSTQLNIDCGSGFVAFGGGADCSNGSNNRVTVSCPVTSGSASTCTSITTPPRYWLVKCNTSNSANRAYAMCLKQ